MARNLKGQWYDDEPVIARDVHVVERDSFTGLYDHNGYPLYRAPNPIGFDPNRWVQRPTGKKGKR